ncbi:MAG: response regulator [Gammaproteobacteria bacterium]|nr:response regulator [Gammaproteobacteria bacterium]MDH5800568.1 response regulator [Gammaproteobacteria bacterium]
MGQLKRILYVDDDADIRAIAQLALESVGGFDVCLCDSGAKALEEATAFAPDLILLDVMMPSLDGPATLQQLRIIPDLTATPAIFLTAKAHPDEISDLKAQGVIDVIIKPFDPMTLSEQILQIWNGL